MGIEKEMSFYGTIYSEGCPGCNRVEPQPDGLSIIFENDYFRVHQDYALPIPGMMVIESKRHVSRIYEFTPNELNSFSITLQMTREAMRLAGIEEATLVQEEKSSHFHAWWLPILPWMKDITNGKLRNIQEIFDHAKEVTTLPPITEVEEVVKKIKEYFEKNNEREV